MCSHDSDLHHLYRYSRTVPVLVCGSFTGSERDLPETSRSPHLELLADHLASVAVNRTESVRNLLAFNGWDSPVAVYVTTPDLDTKMDRELAKRLRRAWIRRDADLDGLAPEFHSDGDPLTH